ncbi:uncharacterized protein TOT_040000225 [Theileria orientalis strain Shintoku]|uniref:Uncharacterized protein n=1 Tax=Theileria orientalis strain Shintoku TaxID=869250 RepID=J4DAA5_THEOR|nr:uncharacterized protein TOT_040000225 [Theileria orientalis strain Shintoku]BAM41845.1 uncharacterized protein TOT_040000225 [Theileria orientalis strain Shintoku]|eukprot:XP_009692146.1 uncharacterized protein TOT_040000225 [Theileria orientalis strain Shintoku]
MYFMVQFFLIIVTNIIFINIGVFGADYEGYRRYWMHRYDVARATEYYSRSAEMGHPLSQYMMAFLFSFDVKNGPGLDKHRALKYLEDSAKGKYTPALLALAYHYLYHPTSPDVKYAIKLYKQVIKDDASFYSKTIFAIDDLKVSKTNIDKYKEVYKEYLSEMEYQNKKKSQRQPGTNDPDYDKKRGCGSCKSGPKPPTETMNKVQKLMNKHENSPENLAPYLIELALMYINGIDLPKNYENAVKLLEKAVSLGSAEAANILGNIFMFGLDDPDQGSPIPVNRQMALKYFKMSALDYNPESLYFLAELVASEALAKGTSYFYSQLEYSYKLYRLSADYGYPAAYLRCAQMLEEGLGVQHDLERAVLNYKTLAEHFYHNSSQYDGTFHCVMEGHFHEATIFSYLSAFSGIQTGQWNAAMLLKDKKCGIFNKSDFKTHLSNALLQGETDALYHLAKIAETDGKGPLSQELYLNGFNSGDMRCIDPLIKAYSKTNVNKAIGLVEYKMYRDAIDLNNGNQPLVTNYYNKMSSKRTLAFLKMKRLLYNMFS